MTPLFSWGTHITKTKNRNLNLGFIFNKILIFEVFKFPPKKRYSSKFSKYRSDL